MAIRMGSGKAFREMQAKAEAKAGMTASEIYVADRQDIDVQIFMKQFDISVVSDTYLIGRTAIREYVSAKASDLIMMPKLRLINGHISVEYTYRSERLAEYLTVRPKARYDSAVTAFSGLTFDDIQLEQGNAQAVSYLKAFVNTVKTKPNQKGMWLVGDQGIGKTHLMGAFAGELKKLNVAFEYIGASQLLSDLKDMMGGKGAGDTNIAKRKKELKTEAPVLIIDDMGTENASAWNIETWREILSYRYDNGLPTFFSSNLTKEDYKTHLINHGQFKTDATRMINRSIGPMCQEVGMAGRNRRLDT